MSLALRRAWRTVVGPLAQAWGCLPESATFYRALGEARARTEGDLVGTLREAGATAARLGFPLRVRPLIRGGALPGMTCATPRQLRTMSETALRLSPLRRAVVERIPSRPLPVEVRPLQPGHLAPSTEGVVHLCTIRRESFGHARLEEPPASSAEALATMQERLPGLLSDLGVQGNDSVGLALDPQSDLLAAFRPLPGTRVELIATLRLQQGWRHDWSRSHDARRYGSVVASALREILAFRGGQDFLDIGAGGGFWTFQAADSIDTGTAHATDASPTMVARLRWESLRTRRANVRARQVAALEVGAAPASVDRILMNNVYFFNTKTAAITPRYLRECARALRPGGRMVIRNDFVRSAQNSLRWNDLVPERIIDLGADALTPRELISIDCFEPGAGQAPGYILVLEKA